jgi:Phospholipase_D-nuclease N-terminal
VKFLLEVLLAVFLHPIAFVLCLLNILGRSDLSGLQKLVWILVTLLWGIGPILYVLVGGGRMW